MSTSCSGELKRAITLKLRKWGLFALHFYSMRSIYLQSFLLIPHLHSPARSTRFMVELFLVSPPSVLMIWSKMMVTTVWARLLVAFMFVEATVRDWVPGGGLYGMENTSCGFVLIFKESLTLIWLYLTDWRTYTFFQWNMAALKLTIIKCTCHN